MKKSVFLLLLSFFMATICSAQVALQVNEEGEYQKRLNFTHQWFDTEITADSLALEYSSEFPEAISNPGKKFWQKRLRKQKN